MRDFLNALFNDGDLIEIRPIECWRAGERKRSRAAPAHRCWVTANECARNIDDLHRLNGQGLNIFIGVNPREFAGGTKDAVGSCRSVWADLDDMTLDEATHRWEPLLPPPSVVVLSGHGIHAYWLLERPCDVRTGHQRKRYEGMLKSLYTDLQADTTNDVSRVLRLPGTWNVKDLRNGRSPEPCVLVHCEPKCHYPLTTFEPWFEKSSEQNPTKRVSQRESSTGSILGQGGDVSSTLERLDEGATDRSRRDFAVVCELLRHGLDPESIWRLVRDRSKFAARGREYFDVTIKNAVRSLDR